jgi:DNA-binding Lrp family transcriptional regulator
MENQEYPIIAPGEILRIEGITHSDIVVYAVIYGLMQLEGYCWAKNGYLATRLNISERTLQRHLKKLQGLSLIKVENAFEGRKIYPVNNGNLPRQFMSKVATDLSPENGSSIFLIKKDNITIKKSDKELAIEELYKNYPLKKGKTVGVKKLAKEIKTEEQLKKLETAIKNYSLECKGSDPKYIKHFSTFAGCWQDYLDAPTRKSSWAAVKLVDGKFVSADDQDQSEEP